MPIRESSISGQVAQLVTDDDLIINKGYDDGVLEDMIFEILDPRTQDIRDPATGENLGSIDRILASVRVTYVQPRLAMARVVNRSGAALLTNTARIMTGYGYGVPSKLTSETWPEGVRQGDPVKYTGRDWIAPSTPTKTPSKPD